MGQRPIIHIGGRALAACYDFSHISRLFLLTCTGSNVVRFFKLRAAFTKLVGPDECRVQVSIMEMLRQKRSADSCYVAVDDNRHSN